MKNTMIHLLATCLLLFQANSAIADDCSIMIGKWNGSATNNHPNLYEYTYLIEYFTEGSDFKDVIRDYKIPSQNYSKDKFPAGSIICKRDNNNLTIQKGSKDIVLFYGILSEGGNKFSGQWNGTGNFSDFHGTFTEIRIK